MAAKVSRQAKQEADALLTSLRMAEEFGYWGMFTSIVTFIRDAGAKFLYLEKGTYMLQLPPERPRGTLRLPSR
jgi:hypothetical protein